MTAIAASSSPPVARRSLKRAAKHMVRTVVNGCVERYLRIDTTSLYGATIVDRFGEAIPYEPLDYPFLLTALRKMDLSPNDVVYDIGCGMGRVLCLLARRNIARCVGIELSAQLADRARANVGTMRGRRGPVDVVTGDASLAKYDGGSAFFMFHPFGPVTMRDTLARIAESVVREPRDVRFMYVNPFHEDVLEGSGWLTCRARLRSRWFSTFASYWVSNGSPGVRGEGNDDQ
jgi:SAM-dependent methyltransferase